ncbi:MAG: cupin domain-containing protein [Burkholderiales bacterium]|nr:cupin domain-containing protein [Burkholderiales bacterium]
MLAAVSLGMPVRRFLREYWQKQPLLIRGACSGFTGLLSPAELFCLACRDDAEARLIRRIGRDWRLSQGPFKSKDFLTGPKQKNWTLLLHDLNHFLPRAAALLRQFDFIPHARVDDVMVSYATEGGGVGPHFDSYDVFLLQGLGQRRWQLSGQQDHDLVADAPLKILRKFKPEQEWLLDPGDMLYLPPGYAHCGVATIECMTYSIGFRAPSAQDLASAFLSHLQDKLSFDGQYADPDLKIAQHPGKIPAAMVEFATSVMNRIVWDKKEVGHFLGVYFSEPKPHVFFSPPMRPLPQVKFIARAVKSGLRLHLKSRLLFLDNVFYCNGESFKPPKSALRLLRTLADYRFVTALGALDDRTAAQLYAWYCAGFFELTTDGTLA